MRRDYEFLTLTGVGGINQQEKLANPLLELADARNLWAPNGFLEARPGYQGIGSTYAPGSTGFDMSETGFVVIRDTGGTISGYATTDPGLGGFGTTSYLYFGLTTIADTVGAHADMCAFNIVQSAANNNSVYFTWDYYNGTEWLPLNVQTFGAAWSKTTVPFNGAESFLVFSPPKDWATTSLVATAVDAATYTRYFIRGRLKSYGADSTLDALTITLASCKAIGVYREIAADRQVDYPVGFFAASFPFVKRYVRIGIRGSNGKVYLRSTSSINYDDGLSYISNSSTAPYLTRTVPGTVAVIPHFNVAYITYNYHTFKLGAYQTADTSNEIAEADIQATVETDPAIIGTGQPYDYTKVSQHGTWPRAKYTLFYKGELWAAGLEENPYEVRWSAPEPNYRVWPILNGEILSENDNSPISGLYGFQESVTVFKSDSIWRMVDEGLSDFALHTYAPIRIVNGVGCVSNSSIQEIRNRLVFLAEDGIYAYDGTSQIKKLSDRIQTTIDSITPGRRPFATAAHWKKKSLYLLSVSVNGSDTNNLVIVYDYKNDAFWLWDSLAAEQWLVDEDAADNERVYFADNNAHLYEMNVGLTSDGAAISSTATTHSLFADKYAKRARVIEMISTNLSRSVSVEVAPDDAEFGLSTNQTGTFDYTDAAEDAYPLTWGTDLWTKVRERVAKLGFLVGGEDFRLKISHSTKQAKFQMTSLDLGVTYLGRRK